MADEKRLIAYDPITFESFIRHATKHIDPYYDPYGEGFTDAVDSIEGWLNNNTVDALEVVHGRWERCGGDLHSSGYAIYCSVCNKIHFVHYKYSLGGLCGCKELFEKPKYCPSCGAFMEIEE